MTLDLIKQFKAARSVGSPLIGIKTADAESLMQRIQAQTNGSALIQWDCIRGALARNQAGDDSLQQALQAVARKQVGENSFALPPVGLEATVSATEMAVFAAELSENSIVFMINAHRFLELKEFTQALWNLRDSFKASLRTIVLLGPDFKFPSELQQDFLILDEPLPTETQLQTIVCEQLLAFNEALKADEKLVLDEATLAKSVNALRGLAAFPAEAATAMSLSKAGLDIVTLEERKRQMISESRSMKVYSGSENYENVGGCDFVKSYLDGVMNGKDAPNVIVFIDEGEKMFAGGTSDFVGDSGVSKDILGVTLQRMEDWESDGAIFIGAGGTAKSLLAKATGNRARVPTIVWDVGAIKGGVVGDSEQQVRNDFKIIEAVGGGRVYFIMTCNKIAVLPPELKRRFTSGIFYFEIPDAETNYQQRLERDAIWPIYLKKYKLDPRQLAEVDDTGWTGAEIRNCARLAYRQNITLKQAARYIVPLSVSGADALERLRQDASGKYLSANHGGIYRYQKFSTFGPATVPARRFAKLEEK